MRWEKSFCSWLENIGEKLSKKRDASIEEALWLIERGSLSQAVSLEIRLRFLDIFVLPAVMYVVPHTQFDLQTVDRSKLDQVLKVYFKYTWGLITVSL